ncbi:hypothetical protein C8Q70DRAFT_220187 [Cubamyces menziesii]|nr:hypothetical protein C8Q70DRAFT_220187 [Cubamyces menziesii]
MCCLTDLVFLLRSSSACASHWPASLGVLNLAYLCFVAQLLGPSLAFLVSRQLLSIAHTWSLCGWTSSLADLLGILGLAFLIIMLTRSLVD